MRKWGKIACLFMFVAMFLVLDVRANSLEVVYSEIKNEKIPTSFNDYKILHLTDFHDKAYQCSTQTIVDKINEINPDIVVVTGDMIDPEENKDPKITSIEGLEGMKLLHTISQTYKVYYIVGNNDALNLDKLNELKDISKKYNVTFLEEQTEKIVKGDDYITISGILDPVIATKKYNLSNEELVNKQLSKLDTVKDDNFNILLAHRPEYIELYSKKPFDLTLSGHTHGGQVLLNGKPLLIPNQKDIKYVTGEYTVNGKKMIINNGLGTSQIYLRINCPIQLGVITLKSE